MPTVRQRYGRKDRQRTDRRTDGRLTIAIPRFALSASRDKNSDTERVSLFWHTLYLSK